MADYEIKNNKDESRFVINLDGHEAELTYKIRGNSIIFTHTGVPETLGGRGLGSALAKAGLEYARANKLGVVSRCPFTSSYIERHPEYQDLVVT